ncbi:hypothetical protein BV25DRAFT_1885897 [Artomyces pyxidatus]|uniref:Uncharacterized protein n=1 Tax=Artomyces pyxidatus TaxID=48021 RepID=A0ACB8T1J8_9AGAM|nr:hypothetical protein BV25DRAFT_1885897 [Artomyces pyxidatus]
MSFFTPEFIILPLSPHSSDDEDEMPSGAPVPPNKFYTPSKPKLPKTPRRRADLRAGSTPISKKTSNFYPFSSGFRMTDDAQRDLAFDVHGKFVGPMGVQDFIDEFLPVSLPPGDEPKGKREIDFKAVPAAKGEPLMYDPLVAACAKISNKLEIVKTAYNSDPNCVLGQFGLKPDVSVYLSDSGRTRTTDLSKIEMHIEVKPTTQQDAFVDPPSSVPLPKRRLMPFEKPGKRSSSDSEVALDLCGQICSYSSAQMWTQFRTHLFSVIILKDVARLVRWDHAGAIVTQTFNYVEQPEILTQFFVRYVNATPSQRGLDQSVRPATRREIEAARRHLDDTDSYYAITVDIPYEDPVTKEISPSRICIAAAPTYTAHSIVGRSTRGMPVFDMASKRVLYLKDTWRVDGPEFDKEGDTYRDLHKAGVTHIPEFIGACDVTSDEGRGQHCTVTQKHATKLWACLTRDIIGYRHYRVLLGTVGRPVHEFRSTLHLVSVIWDAMQGHWEAYQAGILHRDVSAGNIIIGPDGRGLMIDWDLAKKVSELNAPGRRKSRTGTWQFSSVALLQDPGAHHALQDDLESFMHVTTWIALRYCKSNLGRVRLGDRLYRLFDSGLRIGDQEFGGEGKLSQMAGALRPVARFPSSPGLNKLIKMLNKAFDARYQDPEDSASDFDSSDAEVDEDDRAKKARKHARTMEKIADSQWMLAKGRKLVATSALWPRHDPAELQDYDVPRPPTVKKRKSSRESAVEFERLAKKLKMESTTMSGEEEDAVFEEGWEAASGQGSDSEYDGSVGCYEDSPEEDL